MRSQDPLARAIVLDHDHPHWVIWWGSRTHRFWAVPRWRAVVQIIEADDEGTLLRHMRDVEAHGVVSR
ncbi:hypothetical protein ACGFNU_38975 [Spirillospora sp. NPDC048911]|uniref:hypothetical protein n=1 Tax=Spirillospora sp. NPDC048911 TaxID=3364527 RepID=UPI0037189302